MKCLVVFNIPEGRHISIKSNKRDALQSVLKNKNGFQYLIEDVPLTDTATDEEICEYLNKQPMADVNIITRSDMKMAGVI